MERGNAPCRGCEARVPGCHGLCPEYKEWRREQDQRIERRQKENRATPAWPRNVLKYIWREMKGR